MPSTLTTKTTDPLDGTVRVKAVGVKMNWSPLRITFAPVMLPSWPPGTVSTTAHPSTATSSGFVTVTTYVPFLPSMAAVRWAGVPGTGFGSGGVETAVVGTGAGVANTPPPPLLTPVPPVGATVAPEPVDGPGTTGLVGPTV